MELKGMGFSIFRARLKSYPDTKQSVVAASFSPFVNLQNNTGPLKRNR
jgi:hypothetical protein